MNPKYKILLTCPISSNKAYILYDWIRYIKKFTYPMDILLVDNSQTHVTSMRVAAEGINCVHVKSHNLSLREHMAQCNEISRMYAIEHGYDFIFSLECDIFPPLTIIEQLLMHQKPVTAAYYFINMFQNTKPMLQQFEDDGDLKVNGSRNIDLLEGFLYVNGKLRQIHGPGIGCVLMHKSVFQKIKFRVDTKYDGHADSFLYVDLLQNNIPIFVDTSIACRHFNQSWGDLKLKYNHNL